ncbi:primase C-terminal domain-containing protein [Enterococcus cecorum]|uniref:primase C-terminal domain-containing protein n=1 Tax=Enterococcus cecorum TaxID=44008 RepID=UPI002ACA9ED6|nr:primase C-terminal domain-containing protein [Enterococcus cecorum]MDZ5560346.1 primase C-terminal domain-containing protein [Enterococcus cecorum]
MIYIGTVTQPKMNVIEMPLLAFFRDFKPQEYKVTNLPKEQLETIKKSRLGGFISGEMSQPTRKNENLLSRDAIIIDLDDVKVTEDELLAKFSKLKNEFIAYPSISNGIKGVRYRLIMPLDKPVTDAKTYKVLVNFISRVLLKEILGEPDVSNQTWSQIMLLPCLTEYNTADKIIIHDGEKWRLDRLLQQAEKYGYTKQTNFSQWTSKPNTNNTFNKFKYCLELLAFGTDTGERNNTITKVVGYLFAWGVDVYAIEKLVQFMNINCEEPLLQDEVTSIVESIGKKHFSSRG